MPAQKWGFSWANQPWPRDLEEMRRRVNEEFVRPVMHAVWERMPDEAKAWSPALDIFEKGDSIVIKFDLPGLKREDIDVSVTEDSLMIKGERKPEAGVKEEDYRRSEISYGGFYRSVTLPSSVDTQNIEAVYEDGVLRITLQRAAGTKPRKVNVQVKTETS